MNQQEILRTGLAGLHDMVDTVIDAVSADQLDPRPREGGVSAFFSLWHFARTEDSIVDFVVQRRNTAWIEGGFGVVLAFPRTSQGAGMTTAEANAVVVHDVTRWRDYQSRVWAATDAFIASRSAAELQATRMTIKPLGEMRCRSGTAFSASASRTAIVTSGKSNTYAASKDSGLEI